MLKLNQNLINLSSFYEKLHANVMSLTQMQFLCGRKSIYTRQTAINIL